jgi:glycosyltransferase involved in cell wall biosynthesis
MRRRLLFVTDVKLLPLDQGMRVRVSNLVGGCARAFDVTLVAPAPDDPEHRRAIERQVERVLWLDEQPVDGAGARLSDWWAGMRAAPGLRRRWNVRWYGRYAAALRQLDLEAFDLVWAERPHIARLFQGVRRRTIIDLDDIEHRRMVQAMSYQRPRGGAWVLTAYRYALYRWLELTWSRGFLANVVCSEEDRRYLEGKGLHNVAVVPNGINEGASVPREPIRPRSADGALRLAFLGNVAHPPNLDGIEFFTAEVLPLLRSAHPGTVLDVLGPSATPELRTRFDTHARFLGYVPDLGSALAEYDMLVAPIRFGSGTRVKLLDAMACKIPIVTTAAGAEGLPVVDGEHLLLASGASHFAEQVVRLKRDPALGRGLADRGAALVDRRFRSDVIQQQVAGWLGRLAAGAPAREPNAA